MNHDFMVKDFITTKPKIKHYQFDFEKLYESDVIPQFVTENLIDSFLPVNLSTVKIDVDYLTPQ
jgi:hypothetical protein